MALLATSIEHTIKGDWIINPYGAGLRENLHKKLAGLDAPLLITSSTEAKMSQF